ncbi:MAG: hypothetical protein H6532_08885, partial [Thermoleophilales bacterium]|nr:hypothetical protein [Thermoleophilales bacterium]
MNATLPALLAGLAAVLAVAAIAEAFGEGRTDEGGSGDPGSRSSARAWLLATIEPLLRAGREGYLPTSDERFRLALLFSLAAIAG